MDEEPRDRLYFLTVGRSLPAQCSKRDCTEPAAHLLVVNVHSVPIKDDGGEEVVGSEWSVLFPCAHHIEDARRRSELRFCKLTEEWSVVLIQPDGKPPTSPLKH